MIPHPAILVQHPPRLSAGASASFDPQGANLHIAISGIASGNAKGPTSGIERRREPCNWGWSVMLLVMFDAHGAVEWLVHG